MKFEKTVGTPECHGTVAVDGDTANIDICVNGEVAYQRQMRLDGNNDFSPEVTRMVRGAFATLLASKPRNGGVTIIPDPEDKNAFFINIPALVDTVPYHVKVERCVSAWSPTFAKEAAAAV